MSELRERILAVKAQAEAATTQPWKHVPSAEAWKGAPLVTGGGCGEGHEYVVVQGHGWRRVENTAFIAAHDPASVIAACDADLALLHMAEHPLTSVTEAWAGAILSNLEARYPAPAVSVKDGERADGATCAAPHVSMCDGGACCTAKEEQA